MEKILVNSYGDVISFDTETNSLCQKCDKMSFDTIFKVRNDGQVITDTEVIDVKKDEWIITLHKWDENECKSKVIVIYDDCTASDLNSWFTEINKDKGSNEIS